jgi:hypothetical protein
MFQKLARLAFGCRGGVVRPWGCVYVDVGGTFIAVLSLSWGVTFGFKGGCKPTIFYPNRTFPSISIILYVPVQAVQDRGGGFPLEIVRRKSVEYFTPPPTALFVSVVKIGAISHLPGVPVKIPKFENV